MKEEEEGGRWRRERGGRWMAGDGRRDKRKSNRRRERWSEEKERHRCTYFYVIAVEAMHCCRETKANVAEKLRRKGEARGILAVGWVSDGEKERKRDGGSPGGRRVLHARDKAE